MESFNTVIVGAGQAGLAVSYLLSESAVSHVLLERGRIGESWRSQRWDSFMLNTPNWSNLLPGPRLGEWDDDAFASRDELVTFFERYASSFSAPVREQTRVTGVEREATGRFRVETTAGPMESDNVVVASGFMSEPRFPAVAADLPPNVTSLSAADYRNAAVLPEGAIVVVGTAQSGCQIAEDLLEAGRRVYLCVGKAGRAPRRYRGRDLMRWFFDVGVFDVAVEDLEDPEVVYAPQPQVSGTRGGHTVSLQSLARDGATLLGRVRDVEGTKLLLGSNLRECIEFADGVSAELKAAVDNYIAARGLDCPEAEPDPDEPPLPDLGGSDTWTELDLAEAGVSTVIWATGFKGDFSWLRHDILDERGHPRHRRGISEIPGLYFMGFPWLSKRKSGVLLGVDEDARRVVEHLRGR